MAAEGLRRRTVSTGRRRSDGVRLIGAVAAVLFGLFAQPAAAATFDFVYVEANTGGSSGGHVAVCVAERCYHFQQAVEAELLLVREHRDRFEHTYRVLGNRTLVVRRVQVSEETLARIVETFEAYHRLQGRQLAVRDAYAADHELLVYLQGRVSGQPQSPSRPRLAGAGYFFADDVMGTVPAGDAVDGGRSPVTVALADRVRATHGSEILERREAALLDEIHGLPPSFADLILPQAAALLSAGTFFAERYRELLTGFLAISVLRDGRGLRFGTFIALADPALALTDVERAILRARAAELETELVRLVASRRPDWGYPLLVGIARLVAFDASIASGSLVLLDTFSADAPTLPPTTWTGYEDGLDLLVVERREDFLRARDAFFDGDSRSEARWSRLEMAGNLLAELTRAQRAHAAVRVHSDRLVPERSAWRSGWPTPALSGVALDTALDVAGWRERAYRTAFGDLYRYDLLARNCATEVLRSVETGLAGDAGYEDRHVDPDGLLNFIPFIAAQEVGGNYRIVETSEEPSYRQVGLARSYAEESAVSVYLREANVLTSRVYRWHEADPVFLLFSDDMPLARPVFGAVNLAASVAAAAAGLVWLPVDSGTLLRDALNGVLYSLPELAFVSIRKGSFPIAPRGWLTPRRENAAESSNLATPDWP